MATALRPTKIWSTTKMPQDKLPTYLHSLLRVRPTKPSYDIIRTGLGRLEPMVQNTWKLPDISSLHNADRTGTISFEMCKLLFLQKDIFQPTDQSTHTGQRPSATFGRPVWRRSGVSRDSVKTNQPNRFAIGGAYRDRTDDPLLAKQVLSQLS